MRPHQLSGPPIVTPSPQHDEAGAPSDATRWKQDWRQAFEQARQVDYGDWFGSGTPDMTALPLPARSPAPTATQAFVAASVRQSVQTGEPQNAPSPQAAVAPPAPSAGAAAVSGDAADTLAAIVSVAGSSRAAAQRAAPSSTMPAAPGPASATPPAAPKRPVSAAPSAAGVGLQSPSPSKALESENPAGSEPASGNVTASFAMWPAMSAAVDVPTAMLTDGAPSSIAQSASAGPRLLVAMTDATLVEAEPVALEAEPAPFEAESEPTGSRAAEPRSAPRATPTTATADDFADVPRVHAEWSDGGVKVWLGVNDDQSLPAELDALIAQLHPLLAARGEPLAELFCNGRSVWRASARAEDVPAARRIQTLDLHSLVVDSTPQEAS